MEPLKGTIGVFLLCLGLLLLRYLVYGGLFYFGTFRNHFFFLHILSSKCYCSLNCCHCRPCQ